MYNHCEVLVFLLQLKLFSIVILFSQEPSHYFTRKNPGKLVWYQSNNLEKGQFAKLDNNSAKSINLR